jgi:hypothetical protein
VRQEKGGKNIPGCFPGREAEISLLRKGDDPAETEPDRYNVICPADWTQRQFLDYCEAVHSNEVVEIIRWHDVDDKNGDPRVWITNPRAFSNYKKGVMKK